MLTYIEVQNVLLAPEENKKDHTGIEDTVKLFIKTLIE